MKGCGWILAVLGLGALVLLIALANTMPSARFVNMGPRPTPTPRMASTVTIQTVHGPKEKPVAMIGAWFAFGLMTLIAAVGLRGSAPKAKAAGYPGTGCAGIFAVIATGIVLIVFLFAGALATMGGG